MTDDKWTQILDRVQDKFKLEARDQNESTREDGSWEKREWVVFTGPMGRIKLERLIRPAILGREELYSRRKGATATIKFQYSDTETTQVLNVYRDIAGIWEPMDAKAFL